MTVAVVGAGLAGLACAAALAARGCAVEVFEAQQQIGGRVRSAVEPGRPAWELGAQVIHPRGAEVLGRPDALGAVAPGRSDFAMVIGSRPVRSWQSAARGFRPWDVLAGLPAEVSGSLAGWLGAVARSGTAPRLARDWAEQEWACDADLLDAAQLACWAAQRSAPGGTDLVVPAGLDTVTNRLASAVTVHRSQPVDEVAAGRPARLHTAGTWIRAEAVVVTVPPWLLRAPGEPGGLVLRGVDLAALRSATGIQGGDAVSVVVTCPEPAPADLVSFDRGLGFVRCRRGSRRIQAVSKGPGAAVLRAAIRRPKTLAGRLGAVLGWPLPGPADDVEVADWGGEQFCRGAFSGPTAGHRAARGALRALAGRGVLIAGEASRLDATAGRMQGAVQSGLDAATAVVARACAAAPAVAPAGVAFAGDARSAATDRIGAAVGGRWQGGTR